MAFPAEPAGVVTVGVASLADAGMVTVGVADESSAAPVGSTGVPECGGGVVSWGDRLSPRVWCRERTLMYNYFDSQLVNLVDVIRPT